MIKIKTQQDSCGFTADIVTAFLEVELDDQDKDATRFLWLKDLHQEVTKANIQIF